MNSQTLSGLLRILKGSPRGRSLPFSVFSVMDDSPFRRIVLPALLASGVGFAGLTWPLASDHAARLSERLPDPLGRWADSALITYQHKEFSIRYIGFAILSSVAIGIGTAEAMRSQQRRLQHRQGLLEKVLTESDLDRPLAEASSLDTRSAPEAGPSQPHGLGDAEAKAALDWASLLRVPAVAEELDLEPEPGPEAREMLAIPIDQQSLYHLDGGDQNCCLAVAVEGEYYSFYRSRPNLDRARSLVQYLQRRGRQAIATWDDSGYVVWVHRPSAARHATPWPALAARD